jgi:hypothetical protein
MFDGATMDGDVLKIAQMFGVVAMFGAFAVIVYVAAKYAMRPLKNKDLQSGGIPQIDDSRFERLEHAVDAIAVEVERISEAQRFSAKLLSEQSSEQNKL